MRIQTLALLGLGLVVGTATAQPPGATPYASYNFERAYRHFLTSPYPYRTFSSLRPGFSAATGVYPFGEETIYQEPSVLRQRITPRGFESYEYVPGYGGSLATPWGFQAYAVPGFERSFYLPPGKPIPRPR